MLNVGLSGCNGTMGRIIHDLLLEQENVQVVFGIDIEPRNAMRMIIQYSQIHMKLM